MTAYRTMILSVGVIGPGDPGAEQTPQGDAERECPPDDSTLEPADHCSGAP